MLTDADSNEEDVFVGDLIHLISNRGTSFKLKRDDDSSDDDNVTLPEVPMICTENEQIMRKKILVPRNKKNSNY